MTTKQANKQGAHDAKRYSKELIVRHAKQLEIGEGHKVAWAYLVGAKLVK